MTIIDAAPRAAHTSSPTETPEPGQSESVQPESVDVTFAELGLPTSIVQRLEKQRIERPFPIQAAVIPDALAGRDVAGRAPTGSGKTLGFGLPLVARLTDARPKRPVALVLAPTRELAEQIMAELVPFAKGEGHWATAIYGGVGYGGQRKALERGTELVVACPGRLEDLIQMRVIDLSDVTTVVVDEADQMADMGFLPAVRRIVEQTSADRQVLLFSATLDGPVKKLVNDFQHDPVFHEVGPKGPDIHAAEHHFWLLDRLDRVAVTAEIIERLGSTIVFSRTRHGADRLAKQLARQGVQAEPIHGGRSQSQRDRALAAFKKGSASALIATDVAARGIHVTGVSAVVHFDPPADDSTYLHRSGRTARAGATGTVVSLFDDSQKKAIRSLQRGIGLKPGFDSPNIAALNAPEAPVVDEPAPVSPLEPGTTTGGTVKFFNSGRGYGFIRPDAGGADLFVHYTNIAGDGFKSLDNNARVVFTVAAGRNGPEAFEVSLA
jgi:superfamily II DNA/RNA helicase/cold shock CspA family protein